MWRGVASGPRWIAQRTARNLGDSHDAPVPTRLAPSATEQSLLAAIIRRSEPARSSQRRGRVGPRKTIPTQYGRRTSPSCSEGVAAASAEIRSEVAVKGGEREAQPFGGDTEEDNCE